MIDFQWVICSFGGYYAMWITCEYYVDNIIWRYWGIRVPLLMVKIHSTDNYIQIALKIYQEFEVGEVCTIIGFLVDDNNQKMIQKGQAVLDELKRYYENEYIRTTEQKVSRIFKYKANAIGGPIAHKIFTFDKKVINNEPRYIIWRYQ